MGQLVDIVNNLLYEIKFILSRYYFILINICNGILPYNPFPIPKPDCLVNNVNCGLEKLSIILVLAL